jgi:hypothetical protein
MLRAKLNPVAAALLASVVLVLGLGPIANAAEPPTATLTQTDKKLEAKVKWEYKALTVADIEKLAPKGSQDKLTDGLDSLGDQGWELVAVAPGFPELPVPGGLGLPGAGRGPMPPGGPGGGGLQPMAPGMKPNTFVFKRAK